MGEGKELISIVIPAMNEEKNLGFVLDELNPVLTSLKGYRFEVIIIDDHSSDKTRLVAESKGAKVFANTRKPGKGHALITGFEKAAGKYIVMMDADYSHKAKDISTFLGVLEKGAGLVIGSRIYGGSDEYTRTRAFGNIILTLAFGMFHKRYLSDALNGFKAFRKEVFKKFNYSSRDFEIEIELLANALRLNMDIVEVPSHERTRKSGEAKSKVIKHGTKFLLRIIREWVYNKLHGIRYCSTGKS